MVHRAKLLAVAFPAPKLAFGLLALASGCANDSGFKRINAAPTVEIAAPVDGESFRQGAGLLVLTGLVADSYDEPQGLLVRLAVADADPVDVTPDPDGNVTAEVDVDLLALGPVTLVLTATDRDDAMGTAAVVVEIGGPLGAPTVTITTPEDGAAYLLGDAVAFRGEGTDLTTPADDLVFTWSSDLDGELVGAVSSEGSSAVFADALTAGAHTITLLATDADGEVGSDSITVLVEEEDVVAEPGDLVFSEMMVNPESVEDEVGEWVELYNTSGSTIEVGGYTFRDDDVDAWVLEGPLVVAPHDYVVLCANLDTLTNGGVPCDGFFQRDSTGGGLALANGEDELVLTRPDGTEIDWLHYDETWYEIGIGLGLDPSHLTGGDNDDLTHWCDQVTIPSGMTEAATPGAENDPCVPEEM
ncbi:MAG: lamin tail domain-containing protein [Pseudomonadota bacterium]|nr:lamin tail domain-containing protein [Pseudomonadota bacterium]